MANMMVYFAFLQPAHAAQSIPYKINFQGRLTDNTGVPMADGLYNMKFRIFNAATAGTQLWTETRETTNRVQVTNGLFSVQLGDVTALSPSLFTSASPIYFEIELPTPATATCSTSACGSFTEGAMTPRNPLGASAYAFNADTIDGIDGASLAQLGVANTFTNDNIFNSTMTIGSTNSASKFVVQDSGSVALLTVDTTNLRVNIGAADSTGALLVLDTKNTAGDPTGANGAMYYNSSAGVNKFRCYQNSGWTDCIGAGGSSSLQTAYDTSATTNPQILLSSANGGLKIQDGTTPVTGNLFQVGPNGSTTTAYLGVSASNVTLQDAAGNNALLFDSTTSHLKVYENATSPTKFADIYYDTTTSSAIFAASTGTTQIGIPGGSGNISLLLTGASDQLLASKTNTPAGAYTTNDFKFTRNLTAGANTVTGNVMTVEDLTTFSGTNSANILYVNQNTSSATGNLILAQTGGGSNDRFKVTTAGNVTAAGGMTIGSAQSYTGTGALSLLAGASGALTITGNASSTWSTSTGNLTIQAGGANTVILKPGTDSSTAVQVQKSGGTSMLSFDSSADKVSVGVSDTTGTLLVLDTKTGSATDPTGVNGGMYYNSTAARFRCYENGAWADCLGYRHLLTLGSDVVNNNATANTMADITGLTWSVVSGTTYRFQCDILYTSAATTTGSRWAMNGPANTYLIYQSEYTLTATTSTRNAMVQAYDSPAGANATSTALGNYAHINGVVQPSANGTMAARFASEISSSAITAKAGSTCEWW